MNTYVVGFLSFFDNELKQAVVTSENEVTALLTGILTLSNSDENLKDWLDTMGDKTVEQIKSEMFDGDMAVGVLKVS